MDKMVYLLNVNWNWIKQRPQYLAEALSKYYDIDVYEKFAYRRNGHISNSVHGVKLHSLYRLPFEGRAHWIQSLNTYFYVMQLRKKIQESKYIWFASPDLYPFIREDLLANQKVIFDCMDDVIAFPGISKQKKEEILQNEHDLLMRSDYVFASAEHLKQVLIERNSDISVNQKCYVVNNAVSEKLLERYSNVDKKQSQIKKNKYKITYIGTISRWMDWDVIYKSIEIFNQIEYLFYGPCEIDFPKHEQIRYMGVLPQEKIAEAMNQSDLLIMPFIVNNLIQSVNPVKLYEYILSGIPSLACGYQESEKFKEYVYLYHNEEEYINVIDKLCSGKLVLKREDGFEYVRQNTWEMRGKLIRNIIEDIRGNNEDTNETF